MSTGMPVWDWRERSPKAPKYSVAVGLFRSQHSGIPFPFRAIGLWDCLKPPVQDATMICRAAHHSPAWLVEFRSAYAAQWLFGQFWQRERAKKKLHNFCSVSFFFLYPKQKLRKENQFINLKDHTQMEGASKRPEDETVEEWEHPLFMKALPSSDHPDAGTLEALSSLIYEDQTPEQLAEHFKNQVGFPQVSLRF
jgi:hypothetical protein